MDRKNHRFEDESNERDGFGRPCYTTQVILKSILK